MDGPSELMSPKFLPRLRVGPPPWMAFAGMTAVARRAAATEAGRLEKTPSFPRKRESTSPDESRNPQLEYKGNVVALSGGIGGAKLALGLSRLVPGEQLVIVANTGDDFEHLGLHISPDLDTLMYTLAGLANLEAGWGRAGETWTFMAALERLGGESWFLLGDGDLATHVERTRRLAAGEALSAITADFCRRLGIAPRLLPMSDDPVRTVVRTPDGELDFQRWFVERRCEPVVRSLRFAAIEDALPHPQWMREIARPDTGAIVICPSNPFISIDPILALPGVQEALRHSRAPVIAVSPIIGGDAVKGPTAKMMREFGLPAAAHAVAAHYAGLIDGYVLDEADASEEVRIAVPCLTTATLMRSERDKVRLAGEVLRFAETLRPG